MAATTTVDPKTATLEPKKRSKPKPDVLADARKIRDVLREHPADARTTIIDLVWASLAETNNGQ